jgi:hypothetical protein
MGEPALARTADRLRELRVELLADVARRGARLDAVTWGDLPPGDPIFTGGVRFVFGPDQPPPLTPAADEDEEGEFVSPSVPGRRVVHRSLLPPTTSSSDEDE